MKIDDMVRMVAKDHDTVDCGAIGKIISTTHHPQVHLVNWLKGRVEADAMQPNCWNAAECQLELYNSEKW